MSEPTYVKMQPIEHILLRPDMYVGSTQNRDVQEYVYDEAKNRIVKRSVTISPAILRIFIEPVSNAVDNVARSRQGKTKTTKICININEKTGETSIWNDGNVVPVKIHDTEQVYNHSMIFGSLLTGSNYDDSEKRVDISGRQGLGVKLTNVFSTVFTVEGVDPKTKTSFTQTWTRNMRDTSEPTVEKAADTKTGYTKVTYTPDFKQFGLPSGYTPDIIGIYKRIVIDTAMLTQVPVFLNDQQVPVRSLLDYAAMYDYHSDLNDYRPDMLCIKQPDCEVVLSTVSNTSDADAISFANGIYTPLGGTHVTAWTEALFRPILNKLNKPKKPQLTINDVRSYFRIFVVASVDQPKFDSQSKLKLEAPTLDANPKKTHITTILGWPVVQMLDDVIRMKEFALLQKSERKKRGHVRVHKLDPANNEGGKKGRECTLFIVEGDSAKTYVANGISQGVFDKKGRDWNGIYALRGKILNTRNASATMISKNEVVSDIIKSVGLQIGLDYTQEENYNKLRYGRVMLVTDADADGLHICGLLQNMFHSMFPSLLQRQEPFLTSMQTPIVCVYGGGEKEKEEETKEEGKKKKQKPKAKKGAGGEGDDSNGRFFYDERDYRRYVSEVQKQRPGQAINKKYYKGLGASSRKDVVRTFGRKIVLFQEDEKTQESMNKAFHNKHADMRKQWIESYDPDNVALKWQVGNDYELQRLTLSDFINTEMIKFSIDHCKRSIPSLMDGLKEGHRKVLYVCFLRKLQKMLKVAQLAGSVAEKSGYHHGEQNLYQTITNMANAYVGSNNIPLLMRGGQFGSRVCGGKDAANARYISTCLDRITRYIFRAEDDALLDHIEDDGEVVEPRFYVPVLPMILVNGVIVGIGTGWSSSIPCHNPLQITAAIRVWLANDGKVLVRNAADTDVFSLFDEMIPWYRGHTGQMASDGKGGYTSWGGMKREYGKKQQQVCVTELPVGLWTDNFKEFLEDLREEKQIAGYRNYSTPQKVNFVISETNEGLYCAPDNLKLSNAVKTTNMVLIDSAGKFRKYNTVDEIIDEFCRVRLTFYTKRKDHMLRQLDRTVKLLSNKRRFLEAVRDGDIKLFEISEVDGKRESKPVQKIIQELAESKYDRDDTTKEQQLPDKNKDADQEEEEEEKQPQGRRHGYEYLLGMQINSITAEKINKLSKDITAATARRDLVRTTTEKNMWLNDLDEFEAEYAKFLQRIEHEGEDEDEDKPTSNVEQKQAAATTAAASAKKKPARTNAKKK